MWRARRHATVSPKAEGDRTEEADAGLFPLGEPASVSTEPKIRILQHPVWTESKARLIERYLYLFVQVTKHGTYIDGFAGPQDLAKPDTWAAKLVLESEPRRLRQIFLLEKDKRKVRRLEALKAAQPARRTGEPKREVVVLRGDFNRLILRLLEQEAIRRSQAAFCLLDQQTFECHWDSLDALAKYKSPGYKVELFYFLTNHWFGRAARNVTRRTVLDRWWGRTDWEPLLSMKGDSRRDAIVKRFRDELGYRSVKPWPIWSRRSGGGVMYYMIHATDHPEAPKLMSRAYAMAVRAKAPEQLAFHQQPDHVTGDT